MARPRTEEKCQLCPELATRAVGAVRIGEACFGRLVQICADAGVDIGEHDYRSITGGNGMVSVNIDDTDELTGAQIRALREKKGWDEVELAKRANVHKWQIEQWESGERSPQQKTRERLLKAFAGETDAPPQLTTRRHTHTETRRANAAKAGAPAPKNGNGKHVEEKATIVLDAVDFDVTGDGTLEDQLRLRHAFAALESLWRITGALVEIKLPPGRHQITPAIAELVLGQQG